MVIEPGVYSGPCPARELLDRIANKWTALIVSMLTGASGPVRFNEIRRSIGGISQKMLTQTLRDLERDGLVTRVVFAVIPPRVEYELTPLGRTLEEPMRALSTWAEHHMGHVRDAQARFDASTSSAPVRRSAAAAPTVPAPQEKETFATK